MNTRPIIVSGNLTPESLAGAVAIVTGAGSGIGFEAARSLAWLGARVIIAEIDRKTGTAAAEAISKELGPGRAVFVQTDVGDERSIRKLADKAIDSFGRVDIILNNAAVEPLGAVRDALVELWDLSYRVNLRGPVLLARTFLPRMLKQNSGIFVGISSVGGAYMGPYEVFKRAQVELAFTIASECEGTGVISFAIGPGLVPDTRGAKEQIPKIATLMGKTVSEFLEMSKAVLISVEAAGAGFAAAIALASRFNGQEISSVEALHAAGIKWTESTPPAAAELSSNEITQVKSNCRVLHTALEEQLRQWKTLGLFQRQWITRDFSKRVGKPAEQVLENLSKAEQEMESDKIDLSLMSAIPFSELAEYFKHLQDMTRDYVKNPKVRDEQILLQGKWVESAKHLSLYFHK